MKEAVLAQLFFFLQSVGFGMITLLVYDGIRGFRLLVPHGRFLIGFEDFLYWIFVAVAAFVFLYMYNYGQLRSFFFLGIGLGMLIYYIRISYYVMKLMKFLCKRLKQERKNVKMVIQSERKRGGKGGKKKNAKTEKED